MNRSINIYRLPKIAVIIVLLAGILAAGLFVFGGQTWRLLVEDPRNETLYYSIEVEPGDILKFTCRNSVSKSVVTGTFQITDEGLIDPRTTAFTVYGPGLPMEFVEEYLIEDGVITVFHNEEPRENIRLWVNQQTEETIYLHDRPYPLWTLSENHLLLEISIKRGHGFSP